MSEPKPSAEASSGRTEVEDWREWCHEAELKLVKAQTWISDLQSGMYVNCIYCGHRYGPGETTPVSMTDALKAHIETCQEHPMSSLKAAVKGLKAAVEATEQERDAARKDAKYWRDTAQGLGVACFEAERKLAEAVRDRERERSDHIGEVNKLVQLALRCGHCISDARLCRDHADLASHASPPEPASCPHCAAKVSFKAPAGTEDYHLVGDTEEGHTYERCTANDPPRATPLCTCGTALVGNCTCDPAPRATPEKPPAEQEAYDRQLGQHIRDGSWQPAAPEKED